MRKLYVRTQLLLFSVFLVGLSQWANAQIGQTYFKYLNPKPNGVLAQNVSFADNNNGIAVGYYGGIAKTTDGGASWQYGVYTFTDANGYTIKPNLLNCHFVTSSIAYAVGEYGLFLKSTDGGTTWTKMNNPYTALGSTSIYPLAVYFTSATTGYIGGTKNTTAANAAPYLYRTVDGGTTWDSIPAPLGDTTYYGAVASPSKLGITSTNKTIQAIKFVNANVGYISGSGGLPSGINTAANHTLLWKFSNGTLKDYSITKEKLSGQWIAPASGNYSLFTPTSQNYRGMQPANDSIVLLSSQNNAYVYRVRTGVNDSTADYVHPGSFVKGKYEILAGNVSAGGTPGIASAQFPFTSQLLRMAKGPDGKIYVTYGRGLINYTADNGTTWTQIVTSPALYANTGFQYNAIDVTPNGRIISMGSFGGSGGYVTDSLPGQARRTLYTNFATSFASTNAMDFADCDNAIAVGGFGSLASSTDGGKTWTDKTSPSLAASLFSFYGISYKRPDRLYASGTVGSTGSVYSSSDKGTTLDLILTVPQAANGASSSVFGMDSQGDTLWVAGRRAKTSAPAAYENEVFRSFNRGLSWDTVIVASGTTSASVAGSPQVVFTTKDTGYFFGTGGKLFRSVNSGAAWTDISPDATANFAQMSVVNKDTLFICAGVGKVFKSFDAGTTWTAIPVNDPKEQFIGNLTGILFHDSRNGYTSGNSGRMFITNDGGANWRTDHAPNSLIFTIPRFAAKNVPAGTPFANRKVIVASASDEFYEYGNPLTIDIQSTETVVNTTCATANAGSITVTASGGIAPYTYSINGGTFQASNVFAGLTQGPKTITIKESGCGRTITKTVTVAFTDNLTVTANNDTTVCAGAPVNLVAVANTGATYSWSPATGLSATNIANPVATPTQTTTYTVTATLGTCTKTKAVVITIKPSPAVNAGPDKTIIAGDAVTLQGSAINPASITWTPAASLTNANTLTPIARPATTTTYTLSVRNTDNCTSTDDVIVNVIPVCVNVMNAFTPNGDGMNDKWKVTTGTTCTNQIQVAVFNRYGNEVFKSNNYNNDWDGTYNGKPVADGTYYYRATLRLLNGSSVEVKGDVTILR